MSDTIAALATPAGRSGIGVVRLSGGAALDITRKLTGDPNFDPRPRVAHLKRLVDPDSNETIDEAVITYFKAPHSFTGEDVVEISCHGSPVLLRQVIDIALALDARMAEPGEFTLRALANGRIDLAEAEAIRDLIDARTVASARQAVRQMSGEFSHRLQPIKDELLDVIVVLESALEFVEDDLPDVQAEGVKTKLRNIAGSIAKIAETFRAGKLIREGIRVAIVGRPNVGKSSLFNALVGSDRAIVTDIAGTTRDQIHEQFTIDNIPISLIDTAGLRETSDTVESIGVERARRTMADADLVIVVLDASQPLTAEDRDILASVAELDHLIALNKIDLLTAGFGLRISDFGFPKEQADTSGTSTDLDVFVSSIKSEIRNPKSAVVPVSATTGAGIDELETAMISPFAGGDAAAEAGFLVTDARHHDLLRRALGEVESSIELLDARTSEEITLVGLHNALRYLGQITGETTTEDMLTRIFSTFCIGK
ncbi:MAG: tRNA uridine-5-carboxymethylaminomethyl(34) synthesis GTPase MnmE [Pyrinomonadaceae bacterium]